MKKMKDKVELSIELLDGVLRYLQNKPYAEVSNIITRILDEVKTSQESDVKTLETEDDASSREQ
jgi:hypothetical protein